MRSLHYHYRSIIFLSKAARPDCLSVLDRRNYLLPDMVLIFLDKLETSQDYNKNAFLNIWEMLRISKSVQSTKCYFVPYKHILRFPTLSKSLWSAYLNCNCHIHYRQKIDYYTVGVFLSVTLFEHTHWCKPITLVAQQKKNSYSFWFRKQIWQRKMFLSIQYVIFFHFNSTNYIPSSKAIRILKIISMRPLFDVIKIFYNFSTDEAVLKFTTKGFICYSKTSKYWPRIFVEKMAKLQNKKCWTFSL